MNRVNFPMIPRTAWNHDDRIPLTKTFRAMMYNGVNDMKPLCPVCGKLLTVKDYQIAHLVAVKNNGDNSYSNLTATHTKCNTGTDTIYLEDLPEDRRSRILMIAVYED